MTGNVVALNVGSQANRKEIIKSLRELADNLENGDYPEAFRLAVVIEKPKSIATMYFGEPASYSNLLVMLDMAKVRWMRELITGD